MWTFNCIAFTYTGEYGTTAWTFHQTNSLDESIQACRKKLSDENAIKHCWVRESHRTLPLVYIDREDISFEGSLSKQD